MLASFLVALFLKISVKSRDVVIVARFVPIPPSFTSGRGEIRLFTPLTNTSLVCIAVIYGPAGHPFATWLSWWWTLCMAWSHRLSSHLTC